MTHPPHVQSCVTRVTLAALLMALAGSSIATAQAPKTPPGRDPAAAPGVNVQAAAMAEFQKRLQAYLELRERLGHKIAPLSTTVDSAELTTRQQSLAAAMRTARARAKPGDLIPPTVAEQIAGIVRADFAKRRAAAKTATLSEVPHAGRPVINKTYPADEALPTVPPLLLGNLPKLPDNLQYRFYGRHLVILDGDLQIMTDYVADVLPAH